LDRVGLEGIRGDPVHRVGRQHDQVTGLDRVHGGPVRRRQLVTGEIKALTHAVNRATHLVTRST
jgi:hypothetical protein